MRLLKQWSDLIVKEILKPLRYMGRFFYSINSRLGYLNNRDMVIFQFPDILIFESRCFLQHPHLSKNIHAEKIEPLSIHLFVS